MIVMPKDTNGTLDEIVEEYENITRISSNTLIEWESRLNNPFDCLRLYSLIVMGEALAGGKKSKKALEGGLLGYIKLQEIKATKKAENLATTDSLTGLPNRIAYHSMLETSLSRAFREDYTASEKNVALILIDVNNFKVEANDKYGHQFGDDVLKYVADALRHETRVIDGKVRLGGDEFVIIMTTPDTQDSKDFLVKLTQKIDSYVSKEIMTNYPGKISDVSVSLGMSVYGKDANTKEELMAHADVAMYYAKQNPISTNQGLMHCHIFDKNIHDKRIEESRRGTG